MTEVTPVLCKYKVDFVTFSENVCTHTMFVAEQCTHVCLFILQVHLKAHRFATNLLATVSAKRTWKGACVTSAFRTLTTWQPTIHEAVMAVIVTSAAQWTGTNCQWANWRVTITRGSAPAWQTEWGWSVMRVRQVRASTIPSKFLAKKSKKLWRWN